MPRKDASTKASTKRGRKRKAKGITDNEAKDTNTKKRCPSDETSEEKSSNKDKLPTANKRNKSVAKGVTQEPTTKYAPRFGKKKTKTEVISNTDTPSHNNTVDTTSDITRSKTNDVETKTKKTDISKLENGENLDKSKKNTTESEVDSTKAVFNTPALENNSGKSGNSSIDFLENDVKIVASQSGDKSETNSSVLLDNSGEITTESRDKSEKNASVAGDRSEMNSLVSLDKSIATTADSGDESKTNISVSWDKSETNTSESGDKSDNNSSKPGDTSKDKSQNLYDKSENPNIVESSNQTDITIESKLKVCSDIEDVGFVPKGEEAYAESNTIVSDSVSRNLGAEMDVNKFALGSDATEDSFSKSADENIIKSERSIEVVVQSHDVESKVKHVIGSGTETCANHDNQKFIESTIADHICDTIEGKGSDGEKDENSESQNRLNQNHIVPDVLNEDKNQCIETKSDEISIKNIASCLSDTSGTPETQTICFREQNEIHSDNETVNNEFKNEGHLKTISDGNIETTSPKIKPEMSDANKDTDDQDGLDVVQDSITCEGALKERENCDDAIRGECEANKAKEAENRECSPSVEENKIECNVKQIDDYSEDDLYDGLTASQWCQLDEEMAESQILHIPTVPVRSAPPKPIQKEKSMVLKPIIKELATMNDMLCFYQKELERLRKQRADMKKTHNF